jgi:hypothetical protein
MPSTKTETLPCLSIEELVPKVQEVLTSTSIRNSRRRQRALLSRDKSEHELDGNRKDVETKGIRIRGRHWPHLVPVEVESIGEPKGFDVDAGSAIEREGKRRLYEPLASPEACEFLFELMEKAEDAAVITLSEKQIAEAAAYVWFHGHLPTWIFATCEEPDVFEQELNCCAEYGL